MAPRPSRALQAVVQALGELPPQSRNPRYDPAKVEDHYCKFVLRGVRTVSDFEYEYQMALTNRHLAPGIETVFVMPSVQFSYVSSSLIREVVRNGGDVGSFLPPPVERTVPSTLASDLP